MSRFQKYFLACLLLVVIGIWYVVLSEGSLYLRVHFLDVGQGDAVLVRFPNNAQLLIDGGPSALILSRLGSAMPFYDRHIDALVVTHADSDHLSGLLDVVERYEVGVVFESEVIENNPLHQQWRALLSKKNIPVVSIHSGQRIIFDDNSFFDVMWPLSHGSAKQLFQKGNNGSVVGKLAHGSTTLLFTGDIEKIAEIYISRFFDIKSDVLKVPHHGSKTSTTDLLLERVRPAFSVISAGKQNRFGHPNIDVMRRLEEGVKQVFRTDLDGTIVVKSNGSRLEFKTKK